MPQPKRGTVAKAAGTKKAHAERAFSKYSSKVSVVCLRDSMLDKFETFLPAACEHHPT